MVQAAVISLADKADTDTPALIEHIVERYHRVHRAELADLIKWARKVEAVHQDHPECPAGLASFLEELNDVLDEHMSKEEEILFPLMLSNPGHPMIRMPISVMRSEHEEHQRNLGMLFRLTGGLELPDDACGTWRALYSGLRKFADDLAAHIETENTLLFPRFG